MLTAIAQVRLIRWSLLLLGAALVVCFVGWFASFTVLMHPFGITPFSRGFLENNLGWPVLLFIGLVAIGVASTLFVNADRLAKAEKIRQATDTFS